MVKKFQVKFNFKINILYIKNLLKKNFMIGFVGLDLHEF